MSLDYHAVRTMFGSTGSHSMATRVMQCRDEGPTALCNIHRHILSSNTGGALPQCFRYEQLQRFCQLGTSNGSWLPLRSKHTKKYTDEGSDATARIQRSRTAPYRSQRQALSAQVAQEVTGNNTSEHSVQMHRLCTVCLSKCA